MYLQKKNNLGTTLKVKIWIDTVWMGGLVLLHQCGRQHLVWWTGVGWNTAGHFLTHQLILSSVWHLHVQTLGSRAQHLKPRGVYTMYFRKELCGGLFFFYLRTKMSILVTTQIPLKYSASVRVAEHMVYFSSDTTERHSCITMVLLG